MRSARTKAVDITEKTKEIVHERDNHCCIFCGVSVDQTFANAHIIPRSRGGLGIPENIITACAWCHNDFDQTGRRSKMMETVYDHMVIHYPTLYKVRDYWFLKGRLTYDKDRK